MHGVLYEDQVSDQNVYSLNIKLTGDGTKSLMDDGTYKSFDSLIKPYSDRIGDIDTILDNINGEVI